MASQLASQLAQIAANSRSSLDIKAQRAAHSKSLLFEPREATSQSYQTLFQTCRDGFEELCQLDARFAPFGLTIFSEQSQDEDRTQLNAEQNAQLDKRIEAFLRLVGSKLRLAPAIRALEWLVRRFRIHEYNTRILLTTFLPYHTIPAFQTLMSILPPRIPPEFQFLRPYIQSLTALPRAVIIHQAIHQPSFMSLLSEHTLESCRTLQHYPAQISFWAGVVTEALNGTLDRAKSGRRAVQQDNTQSVLQQYIPVFSETLVMQKVPSLQIASYMAVSILASKGDLDDAALSAFMEQIVHRWASESVKPAIVCLAILSQFRSAKQVSSKVAKALLKVLDLDQHLMAIGKERRVDNLANGLCLAFIERLCKKGDSRGLKVVKAALLGHLLKEKQAAVIFKALILAAHRLNDEVDADGKNRKELGITLVELSRVEGPLSRVVGQTLAETEFNIEELEMKLEISIRPRLLQQHTNGDTEMVDQVPETGRDEDLDTILNRLVLQDKCLSSDLTSDAGSAFNGFAGAFLLVALRQIEDPSAMSKFEELLPLHRDSAPDSGTFFSFLIRVWCGPYPALAREAALKAAISRLKADDCHGADFQALVPYCVSALSDPSKKVRRVAAELATILHGVYETQPSSNGVWGAKTLYSPKETPLWLLSVEARRLLEKVVLPALELCVLDEGHIASALRNGLESRGRHGGAEGGYTMAEGLPESFRITAIAFLASHVVATPFLSVKERLLRTLNSTRGVSKSRAVNQYLLISLRWWCRLSQAEASLLCEKEGLESEDLDARFVEAAQSNDNEALECLLKFITAAEATRPSVIRSIFKRIRDIWPSIKGERRMIVARAMLDLSQEGGADPTAQEEAADLLRNVELSSDVLLAFLDDLLLAESATAIAQPPNQRRRTSSLESVDKAGFGPGSSTANEPQISRELSLALKRATFILQLVDGSNHSQHPELLNALFSTLADVQHLRTTVDSNLSYLQHLILRCLLAIMPVYKVDKTLEIESDRGHGDMLVRCIQHSSSPMVQNAAFLVIADLAAIVPDMVIHSVMPIFTFMGGSVMRHSDDYSAHVVNQTIKEVLPPLIGSMRKGKRNIVAAASEVLRNFVTAYEHVPAHRKNAVFMSLVDTLGAQEFLFALVAMLVDKHQSSDTLISFLGDIFGAFPVEVQLETLVKWLGLIRDLFDSKPGLSSALFTIDDAHDMKEAARIALPQLSVLSSMLRGKKLKREIGGLAEHDDMHASKARELYAALLEGILTLADVVRFDQVLHDRCGTTLANLLNLLSIGEFIKAVESLLDRPNINLRQKVLKALEVRVGQESGSDPEARTVLLAFLPELTAAIRNTSDMKHKHTAITCIDKIAEKYGKKDIEAVAAAASVIAGEHCLGQGDRRLRQMALICLASLVDVLQDAIVPVLPTAVPLTLAYLGESIEGEDVDEELHNACYAFITALAQHLPYVVSGAYLNQVLSLSNASAEARPTGESADSRKQCLHFLAVKVDAKTMLGAVERNLPGAAEAGFSALGEYLEVLGIAIDTHSKSNITKNVGHLSNIFKGFFDLRRQRTANGQRTVPARLSDIEELADAAALKMIYKLNDATFRPVFSQLVEWASEDGPGRALRQQSVYGFLHAFFENLKSVVTGYALDIADDAVAVLGSSRPADPDGRELWARVLRTLAACFTHDRDDFWLAPARFRAVAPALAAQFPRAAAAGPAAAAELVPAVVELAAAAASPDLQKELNGAVLRHLRSEAAGVRLAAVRAQQALTERLGEEWLAMLPEMLPYISELQEDDDEVVERETHRWIVLIEGVLGQSLDSMLQ